MKIRSKSITVIIYICIVLLPTILGSYFLIHAQSSSKLNEKVEDAKWVASIHSSHWDQFISDTVTSLEMLSLTARTLYDELDKMQPLLERAHLSDPRYAGIFLLNKEGKIVTGSNNQLQQDSLLELEFIKECIRTKDTIISNNQFTLRNGQKVIGLATPVLDENSELNGVSTALLRIDYVENIMNVLTPDSSLLVLNSNDEVLMKFNISKDEDIDKENWILVPIERLPWSLKVKVSETDFKELLIDGLMVVGIFLIVTHILFLLIKYIILKRQAEKEKQENETQKLELVGSLAASTAHEIRNPLTGIKGLVQLLSEKYDNPNDQFYFSVIHKEIERINEIVSEFLILGKPTAQKVEIVDLTKVLKELDPLITSEATLNSIEIYCDNPSNPVNVKCTKDQMKQVILNITRNAFEAMENGGKISIELSEKKHFCELVVKDNGVGISQESIDKLFTPFYTSKETGTGLGLVVCKRILESFDGKIYISSKINRGTTVTVTLPLAKSV